MDRAYPPTIAEIRSVFPAATRTDDPSGHGVGLLLGARSTHYAGANAVAINEALARLAPLHDHLCPRQVLGVRIGLHAAALLRVPVPQADKRLIAFVETDGCFADGVMVATGCSLGHQTMRLVDHGKAAATLLDMETGRAVRMWPHESARAWSVAYAPDAPDRWHAQLHGYGTMPVESLLRSSFVQVPAPSARSVLHPPPRIRCDACGEEVMNGREFAEVGVTRCRACAGDKYWTPA